MIGGTGNISRWFIPYLLEGGYDVTLLNRGSHKVSVDAPVRTIQCDRTNHANFENLISETKSFDVVIDMVVYEPEDARSAVRAFSGRVSQYIFCSTVDVFDKAQYIYPVNESALRNAQPSFPYAHKKLACERIFQQASEQGNFPLTILRPAATYSEGWSPLITCFGGQSYHLDRMIKKKEMILHGDGSAVWVATHSQDVARAFANSVGNVFALNTSFNVAGDELLMWKSMHCMLAEELQLFPPSFVYIPTTELAKLAPIESAWCVENFQFNNIFDNRLAKQVLGFKTTVPFREGARRCLSHLLSNGLIESCANYPFYDEVLRMWKKKMNA